MRRTPLLRFHTYVPKGVPRGVPSTPHAATALFRATEAAAAHADMEKETAGFFSRPRISYPTADGIPAFMSKKQLDVQYDVFHRDVVDTLNQHTLGTPLEGHNLETVIRKTSFDATQAVIHMAAAEHFNYCFFYRSVRPWGTRVPPALREAFQLQYSRNGSVDAVEEVKRLMLITALSHQERCGWVYLVWTGRLFDVVEFPHGSCPVSSDLIPLLAVNLHEGAYCIDYDSDTGLEQYLNNFFKACNWSIAERYYTSATGGENA